VKPPSLATELRKLQLWLTLICFNLAENSFKKRIDWIGRASQKVIEMGMVLRLLFLNPESLGLTFEYGGCPLNDKSPLTNSVTHWLF
jgi:hypothetical protein